jgi:hyperosmotically inducible periplasmic protein
MHMRKSGALALAATICCSLAVAQNTHSDAFSRDGAGDARLVKEVRHQLLMLPYYSVFDDLGFRVSGDTITLLGDVTRPVLKSDAENVVKRIEGVRQVVNQINVLPLSTMDDQIRMAMARAIYGDAQIGTRYGYQALPSIHIIVSNGHVRLEGVVANDFDKNLINMRARGVPNVFSVDNQLVVEGKAGTK